MSEVSIKVSLSECLLSVPVDDVVTHYRKFHQIGELAEHLLVVMNDKELKNHLNNIVNGCMSTEELIKAIGAEVIVEECSEQIEHEQANVHASRKEDAHLIYEKDGL